MSEQIKRLIEKQIEEVAQALAAARKYHNLDEGTKRTVAALIMANGRLLEIVQNLNNRIDGIIEAYEGVCRRNQSLMDTFRRLRAEKGDCTHPLVKKGECPLCGMEVFRYEHR